jgi:subtilisin family serine protease
MPGGALMAPTVSSMLRRRVLVGLSATALLAAGLGSTASAASPPAPPSANGIYLVQMSGDPVVAYRGGLPGLRGTAPASGTKVDPQSADVVRYEAHLRDKHDAAVSRVGGRKVYDYAYSFDGLAVRLTPSQASAMSRQPGVVSVTADEILQRDTVTTPDFLGLTAPGGLWSQLGGSGAAGEGVVVGVIDSGIWPESPSFSDRTGATGKAAKVTYRNVPGWRGTCVLGEQWAETACNRKLIGARYYGAGYGGEAGVKAAFPYETWSARDADGHGTHTASTAAGNRGVPAVIGTTSLGEISGVAPRARLAVYKSCWGTGDEGGCFGSDSVAAIDQAVADGVDVLNFSISGSRTSNLAPVEVAFFYAASAGVFVAASAGNSGPGESTVAHNAPWLTTVAAGTHDRVYRASVTLGNGVTYQGTGLGAAVPSAPLVRSSDVALPGKLAFEYAPCVPGSLDPAKVTGKIVVCEVGNSYLSKGTAVQQAGGVGLVVVGSDRGRTTAPVLGVPMVHLPSSDRTAVRAYAATAGATASLSASVTGTGLAPDVADFSSRGPALAAAGDLLKPDLMAPGYDVLAAVSPASGDGRSFEFYSGTSMSSPHVAGLGALLTQLHPTWSPAAMRSALMTTAAQTRNDGSPIAGGAFAYGAGHVTPNRAADPGLVYDSGPEDWLRFLCGTGELASCAEPVPHPSDLNYPSIAIGQLVGQQTVTRTVTHVGSKKETYTASAAVDGLDVVVTPSRITLNPGQQVTWSATFTRTSAALDSYAQGAITWSGSLGHVVRSPVVVRPVALAAPAEVTGPYDVTFGYTGPFTASVRGLVPAELSDGVVAQDPDQQFSPSDPAGTVAVSVTVPEGTTHARFQLFDADVAPGSDVDLIVYRGGTQVGYSGSAGSAEQVDVSNPVAGAYTVYLHGWGLPTGTSPYRLHTWLVGGAATGNLTVTAPPSAVVGATGTIGLLPTGLTPGTRYLGSVAYSGTGQMPAPTLVRLDG